MIEELNKILAQAKEDIAKASASNLEAVKYRYLGRKSQLSEIMRSLGALAPEERKKVGAAANTTQKEIAEMLEKKAKEVGEKAKSIDVTAPGKIFSQGHLHPVTQVLEEAMRIFRSLGYEIVEGPEVEDEWHNFEALNIPPEHPARDMQDTFYLKDGNVLRTHTSSVQIRYMEKHKPPFKIVSPGKVYRSENEDASHSLSFNQIEGLVIDEKISFGDLKGTLEVFAKELLGPETKTRFRASFFPYTEPSAELDASCPHCGGKGCRSCGYSGWVELLGSGIVHPQVLRNMGIDPKKYRGFAFGVGAERIAAIKYEIPDIRYFWHPDSRFLEEF
jgi:phenylalanyl-tRNA synthetase alpha chain